MTSHDPTRPPTSAIASPAAAPPPIARDDAVAAAEHHASRARHAAAWLHRRSRETGLGYLVQRGWQAFRSGGIGLVRAHLEHAAAQSAREQAYQRWIVEVEPLLPISVAPASAATAAGAAPISLLTPLYNTPAAMLHSCIRSVLGQTSPHWELVLVDDCSPKAEVVEIASRYAESDPRIRLIRRATNGGIAAATNDALAVAAGAFIGFLDHDDALAPTAVAEVQRVLAADPWVDVVYTDEDKIDAAGARHGPAFKPGFSPHALYTSNYFCHLLVARTDLVRAVGGLRSAYNGAQDYDLVLRLTARTQAIRHIPRVLYHWRSHEGSTAGAGGAKPYAIEAGRAAVADVLPQHGLDGTHAAEHGPFILTYRVRRSSSQTGQATANGSRHGRCATVSLGQVVVWGIDASAPDRADVERALETIAPQATLALCSGAPAAVADALISSAARGSDASPVGLVHASILRLNPLARLREALAALADAAALPLAGPVGPRLVDGAGRWLVHAGWLVEPGAEVDARSPSPIRLLARWRGAGSHAPGYLWDLILPRNVATLSPACLVTSRADLRTALDADVPPPGDLGLGLDAWLLYVAAAGHASRGAVPQVVGDAVLRVDPSAAPAEPIVLEGGLPEWVSPEVCRGLTGLARLTPPHLHQIEPGFLPDLARPCPEAHGGAVAGPGSHLTKTARGGVG